MGDFFLTNHIELLQILVVGLTLVYTLKMCARIGSSKK